MNKELLEKIKNFSEWIAYYFVNYNTYPQVFVFENELLFDTNSNRFGTSEILYNNEKECEIIFDKEELYFCLELLEVDFEKDNKEYIENELQKVVYDRLIDILETYENVE